MRGWEGQVKFKTREVKGSKDHKCIFGGFACIREGAYILHRLAARKPAVELGRSINS